MPTDMEAAACRAVEALAAILREHKATGTLVGTIMCPACCGHLHFRGSYGYARRREIHWRAKCATPGCVEFIQ